MSRSHFLSIRDLDHHFDLQFYKVIITKFKLCNCYWMYFWIFNNNSIWNGWFSRARRQIDLRVHGKLTSRHCRFIPLKNVLCRSFLWALNSYPFSDKSSNYIYIFFLGIWGNVCQDLESACHFHPNYNWQKVFFIIIDRSKSLKTFLYTFMKQLQ